MLVHEQTLALVVQTHRSIQIMLNLRIFRPDPVILRIKMLDYIRELKLRIRQHVPHDLQILGIAILNFILLLFDILPGQLFRLITLKHF